MQSFVIYTLSRHRGCLRALSIMGRKLPGCPTSRTSGPPEMWQDYQISRPGGLVVHCLECKFLALSYGCSQCLMQDQNVACRRTCARPSRNLASTRGDGKCNIDAHEIHKCLYNMTIILRVKRSLPVYCPSIEINTRPHFVLPVHKTGGCVSA